MQSLGLHQCIRKQNPFGGLHLNHQLQHLSLDVCQKEKEKKEYETGRKKQRKIKELHKIILSSIKFD
jgi:hypothetical protein